MKKVIIAQNGNFYRYFKSNDAILSVLADFLSKDVGYLDDKSFQEWILDPDSEHISGNTMFLDKEEGDIVLCHTYPIVPEYYFRVLPQSLVEIINFWQELIRKQPKEIILSQNESGEVLLEGNNEIVPEAALHFRDGRYFRGRSNDCLLDNLAFLLAYNFEESTRKDKYVVDFESWFRDSSQKFFSDQYLNIEKKEQQVQVSFGKYGEKKYRSFAMKAEIFIEVFNLFEKVLIHQPKTIVVTKKNGKFIIEPEDW